MGLTKTTVGVTNISDLSSTPNATEGLTAAQLQAKFDKTGADLKTYINDTLTAELDAYHGNVSATELGYLDGVTSAIQTQFTGKIAVDGWTSTTGTYASASTITVASGAASIYTKGDKLRLKQGAGYKYFYIITVADTLLTVTGGSDYTVADAAITDMAYSHSGNPVGFPSWLNYTPTLSNITKGSGTLTGSFCLTNKTVHFKTKFILAADSAIGTTPVLTMPLVGKSADINASVILSDANIGLYAGCLEPSASNLIPRAIGSASNYTNMVGITATVPFTWTTTDYIQINGDYEME